MSRPRAGIDVDGVLYEWERQARALLAGWWGVPLEESVHYYSIQDGLQAQLGEAAGKLADSWLFTDGWRYDLWDGGDEVPGAVEALRRLSASHDLVIISKRPRVAIAQTWHWFLRQRLCPTEMIIIPPDSDRPKSSVLCDWYVDDSPAVVEELQAAGRVVYLFDRPWNQECQAGERVAGWDLLMRKVFRT